MTTPSTEELQRLLDEEKSGEWELNSLYRNGERRPDGNYLVTCNGEYIGIMHNGHARIAVHSRELAAEVIRLREENEKLTKLRFDHH